LIKEIQKLKGQILNIVVNVSWKLYYSKINMHNYYSKIAIREGNANCHVLIHKPGLRSMEALVKNVLINMHDQLYSWILG